MYRKSLSAVQVARTTERQIHQIRNLTLDKHCRNVNLSKNFLAGLFVSFVTYYSVGFLSETGRVDVTVMTVPANVAYHCTLETHPA